MIAEESDHFPSAHAHAQRRVESVGIVRHAVAVAAESNTQRPAEDAFIGRKPVEPQVRRERKRFVGNRSLRRPQPVRRPSENAFVVAARAYELLAGVFRMAEWGRGQRRARIGHARDVRVAKQRKNGVVKRRGGDFDLSRGSGLPVFGQDPPEQLDLLIAQLLLVLLREIGSLSRESRKRRDPGQIFLVHPGKLRKHLKIAPVALAKCLRRPLAALRAHPLMKFDVARPARQKVVVIELEAALQDFGFVFGRQLGSGTKRGRKPGLVEFSAGVLLELRAQRRHDVERGMHAGKFLDHANHAPVILERMKARPRKHVAPGRGIAILRLVHVPQHHQVDAVHRDAAPISNRRGPPPKITSSARRPFPRIPGVLEWPV